MTLQASTALRNAWLDLIESQAGAAAKFCIMSGSPPANCAAAETGTRLATITCPSDWMNNASGGTKTLLGTWEDTSADNAGIAGYFRIYDNAGTTCTLQGTVSLAGGGGDVILDNTNITAGQDVKQNSFTITAPGA